VYSELIISDLILVEKRLERIDKELKSGATPAQKREKEILIEMKTMLDQNLPLIKMTLNADDQKIMATYQFLTRRPMIIVLNVDEGKLGDDSLVNQVQTKYQDYQVQVMQVSAKIEAELASLSPEEAEAFLNDLNIKESALNQLGRLYFEALGLISFFTVGSDEVHAWTTKRDSTAPEAAGAIHSDLQRGFIRAEIMQCEELIALGSEAKVKEQGKLYLKGKDYIIEDGNIMHVRFNV